jgi:hypothetical protein
MKPFISIYLDRIYRLRLTYGAIVEYEQLAGKPLSAGLDAGGFSMLLWIMMQRDNPELPLDAVIKTVKADQQAAQEYVKQAIDASVKPGEGNGTAEYFDIEPTMSFAAEIGVPISELYDMTPIEFDKLQDAYIKTRKRQRNELYIQAWYTAYFNLCRRGKEMVPLSEFLIDTEKPKPKKEMTDDEILAACRMICTACGGEVVEE